MTTAAPIVPPRPARSQDVPKVPPRPINRRLERSISPNPDRFAPSPLNESPFLSKSPRAMRLAGEASKIDRAPSASVDMPSVGEEGLEYEAVADELSASRRQSTAPEQTRTVGDDVQLFAPKPSLPALSAKQRVMAVTRTDSDRAASFGIGKPSSEELAPSNRSLKKKASTTSQLSTSESQLDDEHGIPEIGQQIPLLPNAGDVQAPSPAPVSGITEGLKKHHYRKTSSRGFAELPPGSYGLHGHGVVPKDKLQAEYYSKHPELVKKEHTPHHYDRPNDSSLTSEQLNKIVRETPHRSVSELVGTPSEQVAWQAIDETASRINSPRPDSTAPKAEPETSAAAVLDENVVHVEEPGRRKSVMFTEEEVPGSHDDEEPKYQAPILASDEVAKDASPYETVPAVEPPPERRGSAFEMEEPHSRPTSRPASVYRESPFEARSTPLEDVKEYEPLFPEEEKETKSHAPSAKLLDERSHRFPSSDVWEEAPRSAYHTAEVSTPEVLERQQKARELAIPERDGETPAQAFARHQEELAEKEARDPALRKGKPITPYSPWQHQPHLAQEVEAARPSPAKRFPSRDVWEDTPDSHKLEATVEHPQEEDQTAESKPPEIPQRPAKKTSEPSGPGDKPAVPERPNLKKEPSQEGTTKPTIPERPKPQVRARPAKQPSGSEADAEATAAARPKPAVPARPVGGKIAALQAGFLSDLNKRLQLGPQAPKKEEPVAQDLTEEKDKAPLTDARKGRARGPQRRAPRSSPSPAAALAPEAAAPAAEKEAPAHALAFSMATTVFSIDPEDGVVSIGSESEEDKRKPAEPEEKTETLVTNTAGETVLAAKVEDEPEQKTVEPVEAKEGGGDEA